MKYLIAIIVAVVVVGGGVYYFMSSGSGSGTMATSTKDTISVDQATGTGSLKSLLGMSGSQQCTVSHATASSESSGTVYVSGGKLRGDFSAQAAGQTFKAHLVVRDGQAHTWIDGVPTGFTASVDTASASSQNQSVSVDQDVDYDCQPWSVDQSMFELPTGIEFMKVNN